MKKIYTSSVKEINQIFGSLINSMLRNIAPYKAIQIFMMGS